MDPRQSHCDWLGKNGFDYLSAFNGVYDESTINQRHNKNKVDLINLANNYEQQIIMFFSGAGGSGKSECIWHDIVYCRSFCNQLRV